MNLELIIPLASSAVGLLATLVGIIFKLISAVKERNFEKAQSIIAEGAKTGVEYAETLVGLAGAIKKEVALTKAQEYCQKNNVVFDLGKVSAAIEEVIKLTKTVNARDKDKKQAEAQAVESA